MATSSSEAAAAVNDNAVVTANDDETYDLMINVSSCEFTTALNYYVQCEIQPTATATATTVTAIDDVVTSLPSSPPPSIGSMMMDGWGRYKTEVSTHGTKTPLFHKNSCVIALSVKKIPTLCVLVKAFASQTPLLASVSTAVDNTKVKSASPTTGARIIGSASYALNAVRDKLLAGDVVSIILTLTSTAPTASDNNGDSRDSHCGKIILTLKLMQKQQQHKHNDDDGDSIFLNGAAIVSSGSSRMHTDNRIVAKSSSIADNISQRQQQQHQQQQQSTSLAGATTEGSKFYTDNILAPGMCRVIFNVHRATNLPVRDGSIPTPFVTAKTEQDARERQPAKAATHASEPSHDPQWEETLLVEIPNDRAAAGEGIQLTIADNVSKRYLGRYLLPVSELHPYHQYNLELVQVHKDRTLGARLFVTVTRMVSLESSLNRPLNVLEVFLQGFRKTMTERERVVAGVRIVSDGNVYERNVNLAVERPTQYSLPTIPVQTVFFPNPELASFTVPQDVVESFGLRVTPPTGPSDKPMWNHVFLLCYEPSLVIFSERSRLVIEYYGDAKASPTDMGAEASPSRFLGYSLIPLTASLYNTLIQCPTPSLSFALDNVAVHLVAGRGQPSIDLELKLWSTGGPLPGMPELSPLSQSALSVANSTVHSPDHHQYQVAQQQQPLQKQFSFPIALSPLSSRSQEEVMAGISEPRNRPKPRPMPSAPGLQQQRPHAYSNQQVFLPEMDVLSHLLSETTTATSVTEAQTMPRNDAAVDVPAQVAAQRIDFEGKIAAMQADSEQKQSLINRLMREVDDRTDAIKRVGQDIVQLRDNNSKLLSENADLRRVLAQKEATTVALMDAVDLDGIDHEELTRKYIILVQKYKAESRRCQEFSQRCQHLQNVLIKKNALEKKVVELEHAHTAQCAYVQKLQEKLKKTSKVEQTCRQQEKIIEKLEMMIEKHVHELKRTSGTDGAAYGLLEEENKKLRARLRNITGDIQWGASSNGGGGNEGLQPLVIGAPELARVREELAAEQEKTALLQDRLLNNGGKAEMDNKERLEMTMKLEKAESRIQALEEELILNTKNFSQRISKMKIEMAEQNANLHGSVTDEVDNGVLSGEEPTANKRQPVRHRTGEMRRASPKLRPLQSGVL